MLSWLKLLTLGIRIIVNVISYKVSDRATCLPLISPKIWCLLGECLDARLGVQAAVCLGLNVIKRFSCQNSPTKNSSRIQSQETRIFSERKKCNQIWWPAGILHPLPFPLCTVSAIFVKFEQWNPCWNQPQHRLHSWLGLLDYNREGRIGQWEDRFGEIKLITCCERAQSFVSFWTASMNWNG